MHGQGCSCRCIFSGNKFERDALFYGIKVKRLCGSSSNHSLLSYEAGADAATRPAECWSRGAPSRPNPDACLQATWSMLRCNGQRHRACVLMPKGPAALGLASVHVAEEHSPTCGKLGLELQDTAGAMRLWAAPETEDACMLIPVAISAQQWQG